MTNKPRPCLVDETTGKLVAIGTHFEQGRLIGWRSDGTVYLQPYGFVASATEHRAESLGLRIGETL